MRQMLEFSCIRLLVSSSSLIIQRAQKYAGAFQIPQGSLTLKEKKGFHRFCNTKSTNSFLTIDFNNIKQLSPKGCIILL